MKSGQAAIWGISEALSDRWNTHPLEKESLSAKRGHRDTTSAFDHSEASNWLLAQAMICFLLQTQAGQKLRPDACT